MSMSPACATTPHAARRTSRSAQMSMHLSSCHTAKNLKAEGIAVEDRASAAMKPAAACDCYPRQRRFRGCWAACRLSTVALLPLQTDVALSRGQNLEGFVREFGKRCHQAEKQQQQIHRLITSFRGRRRCRLAGLMPLTCGYRTNLSTSFQTYVRLRKAA